MVMKRGGMRRSSKDVLCISKKRTKQFSVDSGQSYRHVSMADELAIPLQLRASQYSSMAGAGSGSGPAIFFVWGEVQWSDVTREHPTQA